MVDIEAILEGAQRIKEMRVADAFEASAYYSVRPDGETRSRPATNPLDN